MVLTDEFVGELGRDLGLALIVVIDDLDRVGLRADLEPTASVDGLGPKVITLFRQRSLARILTGGGERRADLEHLGTARGNRRRKRHGAREDEDEGDRPKPQPVHDAASFGASRFRSAKPRMMFHMHSKVPRLGKRSMRLRRESSER